MFELKQNIALIAVFFGLLILSVWFQFGLLDTPVAELSEEEKNAADYYIENFVSTGMDALGKKYVLRADRMVHYPYGDRALLDNPHIVQYDLDQTPRHIHAESGWLYNTTSKVLLTGDVRVVQSQTETAGGVSMGEKMVIFLNDREG
ncbi:MAG: LPS export ABC transporter periplasmic protein LptC [bacterium]